MKKVAYMEIGIFFSGEGFDPQKLKGRYGRAIRVDQELGQIKRYGRGRGKEYSKTGSCSFKFGEETDRDIRIKSSVDLFLKIQKDNIEQHFRIDYSSYYILAFGLQGNMEFTNEELIDLCRLNMSVPITYIHATDIDYRKQKRMRRLERKSFNKMK